MRPNLRGDLEAAFAAFDPEIETYDHHIPDAGEYRGLEGMLRWQADWGWGCGSRPPLTGLARSRDTASAKLSLVCDR